jgi:hypothetical protein
MDDQAFDKIYKFCRDFKPEHINVFFGILNRFKAVDEVSVRKLNNGIMYLENFIQDSKNKFPHGGRREGDRKPFSFVIYFLEDLLRQITEVIESVYRMLKRKRKQSYSLFRGFDKTHVALLKKYNDLLDEYKDNMDKWYELTEPIMTMVGIARENKRTYAKYKHANSRVVNTMNRFNKENPLPEAQPYTGYNQWTHRNQLPIGSFIKPSLSPRTRRSKKNRTVRTINRTINGKVNGTIKGIRI